MKKKRYTEKQIVYAILSGIFAYNYVAVTVVPISRDVHVVLVVRIGHRKNIYR
jgi:hypothetical protein